MADRLLDAVEVRSPCLVSWAAMAGDDRVRHCSHCRQNVYNLSEMSRREAELLLREHEGRVCVRYYRRPDGTVVTGDCHSKMSSLVRRRVALAVTLTLSLLTVLFGITLYANSQGTRLGRLRNAFPAPVQKVLDWIDPPVVMGGLCPPVRVVPVEVEPDAGEL